MACRSAFKLINLLKLVSRLMMSLLLSSLLTACVPTITTVYLKPSIKANVVNLSTLTPTQSGWAIHYPALANSAYSKEAINPQGEFILPAVSNTEFKMMMAGHMLQYYLVKVSNDKQAILAIAQATAEGTMVEEKVLLPTIVIDNNPKKHAKAPQKTNLNSTTTANNFYDYDYIRALLFPHSLLSSCDTEIGLAALAMLNTARKLYWQQNDSVKQYMQSSYFHSYHLWRMMKASCDIHKTNRKAFDLIDDIMTEAEQIADIYTINFQHQIE